MDPTDPARRADGTVGTAAHRDGGLADPITAPIPRIVGNGVTGGFVPADPSSGAAGRFVAAHPGSPVGLVPAQQSGAPAASPGPQKPAWTLSDVFVGLGVTLLLSLLITAVARIAGYDGGPALLLLGGLPIWIALLGTTIWACRRHGVGRLVVDLGLRFQWSDLWIGLAVGVGLRFAIGIWATVIARATGELPASNVPELGGAGLGNGFWVVVNVTAIVLIGPIVEEIFFRGLALRSALATLLRRADRPRLASPARRATYASLITALLFSLLHVGEVPTLTSALVLIPGLFFAGWVMARLTIWRQRLGPAIVTHVVFNGSAVAVLLALT